MSDDVANDPKFGKQITLTINELTVVRLALMDRANHLKRLGIAPDDPMVTACGTLHDKLY